MKRAGLEVAVLVVSASVVLNLPVQAGTCPQDTTCQFLACRSGATGVPGELWGTLRPTDTGPVPANRDTTDYDEFDHPPTAADPHWSSLDIENGWLFAGIEYGLEIWDARGANAAQPQRVKVLDRFSFPFWFTGGNEVDNPVRDVDAPPGIDSVVAVASISANGFAVFNTSNKALPVAVYGDHGKSGYQVWATSLEGTHYAFMATEADGLLAYNLSAAAQNTLPCVEVTPLDTGCGVFLGRVGNRLVTRYVDGVDGFLVASSGANANGFELWDVRSPTSPSLILTGLPQSFVYGVALWRSSNAVYLAARVASGSNLLLRIYDLSCLNTDSCNSLGAPLASISHPATSEPFTLTHSQSFDRETLYLGSTSRCDQTLQAEWLYDVTTPSSPVDLTPPPALVSGVLTGYWGWYYRRNPTGFNFVGGRAGKFAGAYFYRAANTLFDVHERVGAVSNVIFSDGFESGGVGAWSDVVP